MQYNTVRSTESLQMRRNFLPSPLNLGCQLSPETIELALTQSITKSDVSVFASAERWTVFAYRNDVRTKFQNVSNTFCVKYIFRYISIRYWVNTVLSKICATLTVNHEIQAFRTWFEDKRFSCWHINCLHGESIVIWLKESGLKDSSG